MKFIYCRGGDKTALEVAAAAGWHYGTRDDYTAYTRPAMVDFNWSKPATPKRWAKYLSLLKQHQPHMALVPDYEHKAQLPTLLKQIEEVRALGVLPMVCPKFAGAVADIPPDVIVAVSVPTRYAGFLPHPAELVGRKLHFLGGHPDQHAYLMQVRYAGIEVYSIDANALAMEAGLGKYWCHQRGDWAQTPTRTFETKTLAMVSAINITKYLTAPAPKFKYTRRVRKCMQLELI